MTGGGKAACHRLSRTSVVPVPPLASGSGEWRREDAPRAPVGDEVFTRLPRAGRIDAAQMLAESSECREVYPEPRPVAKLGGMCPVTHASGDHPDLILRRACGRRLDSP